MSKDATQKPPKTASIENNIEKNNRRLEINEQVINWLHHTKSSELNVASLPAEHWYAEHMLNNMLERSHLPHLKSVTFHGAEYKDENALLCIKNIPENGTLFNTSLHYMITRKKEFRKSGVGYITEEERIDDMIYNFIWADYCGNPNATLLRHVCEYMNRMKSGMFYVTFSLSFRRGKRYSDKAIINKILETVPKANLCYKVLYRGGEYNRSNMITVGFYIGNKLPKYMYVINKDIRESKQRHKNGQVFQVYRNDQSLLSGSKKRGRKPKVVKSGSKTTPEQKEEIRKLLAQGLKNDVISNKLNIPRRCVGATASHFNHPESFKNTGRKRKHESS